MFFELNHRFPLLQPVHEWNKQVLEKGLGYTLWKPTLISATWFKWTYNWRILRDNNDLLCLSNFQCMQIIFYIYFVIAPNTSYKVTYIIEWWGIVNWGSTYSCAIRFPPLCNVYNNTTYLFGLFLRTKWHKQYNTLNTTFHTP